MKVLVADKFPDLYINQMKESGCEVVYSPKLGENDMAGSCEGVNVIVVRSTNVNAATINAANDLKLVIRAGSGYNNIDTKAATEKGVAVANTPGKNAIAVAELAMGLICALDRKIPENVADFNNGVWNKDKFSKADGLYGKTLGVIGTGNIGKELAKRAAAFGMKVYGYDIVEVKSEYFEFCSDLDKIVRESDVLSLHLPANAQTKGLFNDEMFAKMKNGAFLINTSRSQIVNEDALLKAIAEKNIKAAMDVFDGEPEGKDGAVASKLQNNSSVYVTHHIGASTNQAQDAVAEETVLIISSFNKTGEVLHKVN